MGIGDTLDTIIMQCGGGPTTVQVDYRVTRSLTMCRYIIISSECSAQMGSEQAGEYSSSSRNNASSTIEGKGDMITQAYPEGP